jgi:CRP/FNR family transcriptional regulator
MKMTTKEQLQSAFPFLMSENLIQEILDTSKEYHFNTGDIVIDLGVAIPFIPLILKGSLRVVRRDENDHELLLYYINRGQTCATSLTCCMSNIRSEVEAVAEEPAILLGIPAKKADEWFDKYPDWKAFVLRSYKFRFDELLDAINSIAFTQLDERLVKYLQRKADIQKSKIISTSHQEIANDLNSSREVISRLLKQLENQGKVKLSRNVVELVKI